MLQAKPTITTIWTAPGAYELHAVNSIVSLFLLPSAANAVPVEDMPRCQWYGQHRYDFHSRTGNQVTETCMDCSRPRTLRVR